MKKSKFLIFSLSLLAGIATVLGFGSKAAIRSNAEDYLPAYVSSFNPHSHNGNVMFTVKDLAGTSLVPETGPMTYLVNGEEYTASGINKNSTSPFISGQKARIEADAAEGKTTSYTFLAGQTFTAGDKSYKFMFDQTAVVQKIECAEYTDGQETLNYKYVCAQQPAINPTDDELEYYDEFSICDLGIDANGEFDFANIYAGSTITKVLTPSEDNTTKSYAFRFKMRVSSNRATSQTCFRLKQGGEGASGNLTNGNWVLPVWSAEPTEQRYHAPNAGGGVYGYSRTNGEWVNFEIRSICLKDSNIYMNQVRINGVAMSAAFTDDAGFAKGNNLTFYRDSDVDDLLLRDWNYEEYNAPSYVEYQGERLMWIGVNGTNKMPVDTDYGLFGKYDIEKYNVSIGGNQPDTTRKISFPKISASRYTYAHVIFNNGTWNNEAGVGDAFPDGATFGFQIENDAGDVIYTHSKAIAGTGINDVGYYTFPIAKLADTNGYVDHFNIRRIGYTGQMHFGYFRFDNSGLIEDATVVESVQDPILNAATEGKFKCLDQTAAQYVTLAKGDATVEAIYASYSQPWDASKDASNNYGFSEFRFDIEAGVSYKSVSFSYKYYDADKSHCETLLQDDKAYGMKSYFEIKNGEGTYLNASNTEFNGDLLVNDGEWHDVTVHFDATELQNIIFKVYHLQGELIVANISLEHVHAFGDIVPQVDPTCTEDGVAAHYVCTVCGGVFTKDGDNYVETTLEALAITKLGHEADTEWQHNDTHHWHNCIHDGCTEELDKAEHNWGEGSVTTAPTCTTDGVRTYTCECGATKTEVISKLGHEAATEWQHNDTHHWHNCTHEGCTEELDKAEHNWGEGVVTTAPTCTADGVRTFTCECGATKTEVEPALGHEASTTWSHDDTHHWHDCTHDGCNEQLDKAEHVWDEGEVTTAATCEADGVRTYTCECGATKTEVIPATGHNYTFVERVEATKDANGCEEHYVCEDCGKVFVKDGENYVETTLEALTIEYVAKGCGGSIVAVSGLVTVLSLLGMAIVSKKRR